MKSYIAEEIISIIKPHRFYEKDLMESAKAAKGRWNPEARLWFIRFGKIKGTTLEKHIVLDAFPSE